MQMREAYTKCPSQNCDAFAIDQQQDKQAGKRECCYTLKRDEVDAPNRKCQDISPMDCHNRIPAANPKNEEAKCWFFLDTFDAANENTNHNTNAIMPYVSLPAVGLDISSPTTEGSCMFGPAFTNRQKTSIHSISIKNSATNGKRYSRTSSFRVDRMCLLWFSKDFIFLNPYTWIHISNICQTSSITQIKVYYIQVFAQINSKQ